MKSIVILSVAVTNIVPFASVQACEVTLSADHLASDARLAGFEIDIPHAAVVGWSAIPVGWSVVLNNDPQWRLHLTAKAMVGAAFTNPGRFGVMTLQPQPGYACESLRNDKAFMRLTLFENDHLFQRSFQAEIHSTALPDPASAVSRNATGR